MIFSDHKPIGFWAFPPADHKKSAKCFTLLIGYSFVSNHQLKGSFNVNVFEQKKKRIFADHCGLSLRERETFSLIWKR
jgi:hypothetical protein